MGVDPGPLTFGELLTMSEAASRERWNHTSAVVAMIHNVNCTKRSDMLTAKQIHPMRKDRKSKQRQPSESIVGGLCAMYAKGKGQ